MSTINLQCIGAEEVVHAIQNEVQNNQREPCRRGHLLSVNRARVVSL
jgi:hypothetical protein